MCTGYKESRQQVPTPRVGIFGEMQNRELGFFEILDTAVIVPLFIYPRKAFFLVIQQCFFTFIAFGEILNK